MRSEVWSGGWEQGTAPRASRTHHILPDAHRGAHLWTLGTSRCTRHASRCMPVCTIVDTGVHPEARRLLPDARAVLPDACQCAQLWTPGCIPKHAACFPMHAPCFPMHGPCFPVHAGGLSSLFDAAYATQQRGFQPPSLLPSPPMKKIEIGRASCRERV